MSSIKLTPFPFPFSKPPTLLPFTFPFPPSLKPPKPHQAHAFYTSQAPVSFPPPKPSNKPTKPKPPSSGPDDIAALNERIRRDLSNRELSRPNTGPELDSKEAEKYIKIVKQQQQRGLQKLKGGDAEGKGSGFRFRVDPYSLRPGDYVVHKKVGIGRFVAIKYDVGGKGGVGEPVEYVFIEYGDGMAKLPVKQAARMLYRYNL